MELHILNPYQPMIRKHQLPFCNATKGSLLTFLPILIVRITFDDAFLWDMEHAAGGRFVDLALAAESKSVSISCSSPVLTISRAKFKSGR